MDFNNSCCQSRALHLATLVKLKCEITSSRGRITFDKKFNSYHEAYGINMIVPAISRQSCTVFKEFCISVKFAPTSG
jgi:hypothetical protein